MMNRRLGFVVVFSFFFAIIAPARAAASEPMVAIPNNHPAINFPTSPAPPEMELHMTLTFKIRNRAEWDRVTRAQRDPSSPESKHIWTPKEYHQRFGTLPDDFHMVEQWLMQNGFTILLERYGGGPQDSILFTGTVAQVEKAFEIKMVKSETFYGNTSDPVVPARIAALVYSVTGLDNAGPIAVPQSFRNPDSDPGVSSLTPASLYSTYNETPLQQAGISGSKNACIAIAALSDYSLAALTAFDNAYSLPAPSLTNIFADGSDPNYVASFEGEALADIEWAHAVAPTVPIIVHIGNPNLHGSGQALVDALQSAATANACAAITASFAFCNPSSSFFTTSLNTPISQAFGQHQSLFVSSDDYGSAQYYYDSAL